MFFRSVDPSELAKRRLSKLLVKAEYEVWVGKPDDGLNLLCQGFKDLKEAYGSGN